jgi:hypothetical protein
LLEQGNAILSCALFPLKGINMTQPRQVLPKRRPQTGDDEVAQTQHFDTRRHDDANLQQDALHQDVLHQDAWVTNFIGRLTGLVRHIGKK